MVSEILNEVRELEAGSEELNATVSQQVADIIEEVEQYPEAEEVKAATWRYTVPFAGVRYYWY